jgi:glycosyltransferase involved in cell wall biosynthesis
MAIRVAHIITRCIAGAGGVAVRGAVSLDPDEYTGTLITGSGGPLLDVARSHGLEVLVVPTLVSPISPRNDAMALATLTKILRQREIEIVHTHSAKAGALGRVAAHRAGASRIVHTLHGFPFHEFQPRATRSLYVEIERRLSHITDMFLATGTAVAVEAIRLGIARPEQIRTIGPAVEARCVQLSPATRMRARQILGLPADAEVIGTVGRLDFQKAPEVLIEALARMRRPAVLVWAGDGPLMDQARRQVARMRLGDRVLLLGNRTDVPDILPAFDVFAMSSRYEGLPCVIVEAQACGIPVVATAVNAVPDVVVPGESGLLVPPGRADLLASAMDFALDNPHSAASWAQTARTRLGSRYSASTLGAVLSEVYRPGDLESRFEPLPVSRLEST